MRDADGLGFGHARRDGGVEVALLVADHPGSGGVEVELGAGAGDHAAVWFAPLVLCFEVRDDARLGVERARVPALDERVIEEDAFVVVRGLAKVHAHAIVAGVDIAHGAVRSRNAALVGDDDKRVPGVLERDEGFACAGDEDRVLGLEQVAPLDPLPRAVREIGVAVNGVVTIEEDRGAGRVGVQRGHGESIRER